MQSKIIEKEVEQTVKYPCLMKSTEEDIVVLFTTYGEDPVVWTEDDCFILGKSYDWVMSYFTPFNGTIELSN